MHLTATAAIVRKVILGTIIFIVGFFIFKLALLPLGTGIYKVVFPPKDLPNPIFGKLDPPEFIEQSVVGSNIIYELNTKTGKLPTRLPVKAVVYKYKPLVFSYNAGRDATETAKKLGFEEKDLTTSLKGDVYKWRSPQTGGTLEIDINTREVILDTNLAGKTSFFAPGSIIKAEALRRAKDILTRIGQLKDPLYLEGNQKVYLGKIKGDEVTETNSTLEAQIARVDFFRSIKKVPICGPNYNKGLLSIVVGPENLKVLALNYLGADIHNWEIETTSEATYPLIPVETAWEAVRSGKGVISSVAPSTLSPFQEYAPTRVDKIIINQISLAYYDSLKPQKYLHPIYVFEGNYSSATGKGNIVLYFPAIDGQYIKQETANE